MSGHLEAKHWHRVNAGVPAPWDLFMMIKRLVDSVEAIEERLAALEAEDD